jgi:hypothetical protein
MILDNRLGCYVNRLQYDFNTRKGQLFMGPKNCCDASGCIELFKAIDPEVKEIETFEGANADTVYLLRGGEWCSRAAQGRWAK